MLHVIFSHVMTKSSLLGKPLSLAESNFVNLKRKCLLIFQKTNYYLFDMIIQVGCGVTRVVAERTNERFLRAVYRYVVLECFSLV